MVSMVLVVGAVGFGMSTDKIGETTSEDIGREARVAEQALRRLRELRKERGEDSTPRCIS
jgi:hypothetical protein